MNWRQVIFWLHLSVGVAAGLIIMVMAITGTILAFEPQIVAWAERDVRRVAVVEGQERLSLDDLMMKAAQFAGQTPSGLTVHADPHSSVAIQFGRERLVYINPYTGAILGGESKMHEWMEDVEVWHRWLGMGGPLKQVGHHIKAACNLLFLVLVVSGLFLWWPRQWQWKAIRNIFVFNRTATGRARDWNWHNVIGFWCAPLLITIALTGFVMSYAWANALLFRMTGNEPPPIRKAQEGGSTPGGRTMREEASMPQASFATLIQRAQEQVPDWETISVRLGQKPQAPVTVMIRQQGSIYPSPRSTLTLDASSAAIKKWEPLAGENLGRRLRVFVRYLHTGEVGGIVGQGLAMMGALGACILVWTGLAMAWLRFDNWRLTKNRV